MTWGEFKASVEKQGVKDGTEIAWIDCTGWPTVGYYPGPGNHFVDLGSLEKWPDGIEEVAIY